MKVSDIKVSNIADKFGSLVSKQRTPIEMALIVLILIHYAPTEVFGTQINSRIKGMLGPVLTPVKSIMANVYVRFFLWLVLLYACCYSKDMGLFFLVAIYFVQSSR